ncbi:MAG TPA: hypothetical protein DEP42_02580 [Ruminococcaceae bacterium]|nr:hypothetical protein [Oscillospiraceae bacterium]
MRKSILAVGCIALLSSLVLSSCSTTKKENTGSLSTSSRVSSITAASSFPVPESDPNYVQAYGDYDSGKYETAIELCDQAIAENAQCFWAYNLKGISTYFENGNSAAEECLALINKSTDINPNYSYGYFNKALIQKGIKKWDASLSNFNKALSLKPNDTWSYYGIATVYADTKQNEQALNYLKLAIKADPTGVKAQIRDDLERHFSSLQNDSRFQELLRT